MNAVEEIRSLIVLLEDVGNNNQNINGLVLDVIENLYKLSNVEKPKYDQISEKLYNLADLIMKLPKSSDETEMLSSTLKSLAKQLVDPRAFRTNEDPKLRLRKFLKELYNNIVASDDSFREVVANNKITKNKIKRLALSVYDQVPARDAALRHSVSLIYKQAGAIQESNTEHMRRLVERLEIVDDFSSNEVLSDEEYQKNRLKEYNKEILKIIEKMFSMCNNNENLLRIQHMSEKLVLLLNASNNKKIEKFGDIINSVMKQMIDNTNRTLIRMSNEPPRILMMRVLKTLYNEIVETDDFDTVATSPKDAKLKIQKLASLINTRSHNTDIKAKSALIYKQARVIN